MSTLLPPTPEMLQHVLTQGGIPQRSATASDPMFAKLLNETRTLLCSASFQLVLEACLDRATEVLFIGLEKNVFRETNVGGWEEASSTATSLGQEMKVRLAGMLPGLARWSQLALEGLPNELIDVSTPIYIDERPFPWSCREEANKQFANFVCSFRIWRS